MLASHPADDAQFAPGGALTGSDGPAWRPVDAADALAALERVSRYCAFSCTPDGPGCTDACEAWRIEQIAAAFLADRLLDLQD